MRSCSGEYALQVDQRSLIVGVSAPSLRGIAAFIS